MRQAFFFTRSDRLRIYLFVLFAVALACGQATPVGPPTPTMLAQPSGEALVATNQGTEIAGQTAQPSSEAPLPTAQANGQTGAPILIGSEYVVIEIPWRVPVLADMLAPIGLTAAKPLPENFAWGKMQSSPEAEIDFTRLDKFVSEFQRIGVNELVLALRSLSDWATNDVRVEGFFFPLKGGIKAEYLDDYENWVGAVVERYDGDGNADMPGLRAPVHYYEIGVEFSSYEPEPVEEYLAILERAYRAAHAAYADVLIAHVAFLATPALFNVMAAPDYDFAFTQLVDKTHPLADMRAILDRPGIFDVLNIHSLGHPYEIEAIVAWLNFETGQRGYQKPIIISDTGSTPFIAWGAATACGKPAAQMGKVVPPATDADRCRLADYFTKLVAGDAETMRWTQEFVAQDTVKRVVVATEQGIALIDTAFTEDLLLLKLPLAQAGAGTAAWAGLVDFDRREFRPSYYALQQLIRNLGSYESITRLAYDDEGVRVYQVERAGQRFWIAWYDPRILFLPGETIPQTSVQLNVGASSVNLEALAISQAGSERQTLSAVDGVVVLTLTPAATYLFEGGD